MPTGNLGNEVSGLRPLQLTTTLGPGFYILEIHTEANGPPGELPGQRAHAVDDRRHDRDAP
jgi:hypothetical protein